MKAMKDGISEIEQHTIRRSGLLQLEAEFWKKNLEDFVRGGGERLNPSIETLSCDFTRSSDVRFIQKLGEVRGRRVLEVGSGLGDLSLLLAEMGAEVVAIDIEAEMLMYARGRQEKLGLELSSLLADAMNLPFRSNSFDLVVAMRTLHHLPNLPDFFGETLRVLKEGGGRAVFVEPLRKNPIVEVNRKVLHPECRTESEHPLVQDDLEAAEDAFGSLDIETYYLISPIAYVFERLIKSRRLFDVLFHLLQTLEKPITETKLLRPYCWQVIISVERPSHGPDKN